MNALQNTPEDLMAGRAVQPEILASFETISSLEEEVCGRIAEIVSSQVRVDGELFYDAAVTILGGSERAKRQAAEVMNAVVNTSPSQIGGILEKFRIWVSARPERKEVFTAERLDRLQANLETLTRDQDAIKVLKKADDLVRSLGNELQGLRFVCDLRPVFDEQHERIDSIVHLANLKIIYLTQVGDRQCFELALTNSELTQLRDLADDALKKMSILAAAEISFDQPMEGET